MKVSLNIVKKYTNIDISVDELVSKINGQLGGVEEVINLKNRYEGAIIARIVSCEDHSNADKLHVCMIDDGGVVADVERDEKGYVQVVCGAPNAREGIFVVWLPPKSVVPSSFDDAELFVLDSRNLRGVLSNGMLASAKELALGDDHDGILELDSNEVNPSNLSIEPGVNFAKVFGLDDTIIDIENKMFTHRPDCFGQLGVAREIAGIQHRRFESPDWYVNEPLFDSSSGLSLEVRNSEPNKVPRFTAVAIKNIEVKPSPLWLQVELVRLGGKPINNIVDITNYAMLLTGQPLHAYDYDVVKTGVLDARLSNEGEKIELLNGKSIELTDSDIVITDGDKPIGLGGVMGGANSEVSNKTTNIILECATFDMYTIRKTSMRHGLFTDAVTRFNKGQSALQNMKVLSFTVRSVIDLAGGQLASDVVDVDSGVQDIAPIFISETFINERLGLSLNVSDIKSLLENVEFVVSTDDNGMYVKPPFWRTDIELPEDIVEEVGRLYGFDNLPRELPYRTIRPAKKNANLVLKQLIRNALVEGGVNEVLTHSFVHERTLVNSGQNVADSYQLSNSLSPDLQYYRQTITPSLLSNIHANIKSGHDKFALFEIGKGHQNSLGLNEEGVPFEAELIALSFASKKELSGASFYQARRFLDYLAQKLGVQFEYAAVKSQLDEDPLLTPFEHRRSAVVSEAKTGNVLGVVGEYKSIVRKGFKLPDYTAGFELRIDYLRDVLPVQSIDYAPLSRFPSADRDVCFQVTGEVIYADILRSVDAVLSKSDLRYSISPIDIYQSDGSDNRNITIRINLTSYDKTLDGQDIDIIMSDVIKSVQADTKAKII